MSYLKRRMNLINRSEVVYKKEHRVGAEHAVLFNFKEEVSYYLPPIQQRYPKLNLFC